MTQSIMNPHSSRINLGRWLTEPAKRDQVYCALLQLFIILYIPLIGRLGNVMVAVLVLFWFTEPGLLKKIKNSFRNKIVLSLMAYYAVFLIGMLYTENLSQGFLQLERKVTLFIFPILFVTITLSQATLLKILKTYLIVSFLAGLAGLINGIRLVLETHDTSFLYSDNLTLLMYKGQGIYFAVTITLALVFTFYLWFYNHFSAREKILYVYIMAPCFAVLEFLLAGRLSLGVLFILIVGGLGVLILQQKKYKLGTIILSLFVLSGISLAIFFPKTINRFKSLAYFHFDFEDEREVYHFGETDFEGRWSGLTIRLAIWTCAVDAVAENPVIGAGTGDYNDALFHAYRKRNFKQGLIHKFNPHNQYLHALLSGGVIALAVFLFSLAYPALQAMKAKNILYLIFLFVIMANMLIMDFLDVYRGAVFFAFFNSLLLFQPIHYHHGKAE